MKRDGRYGAHLALAAIILSVILYGGYSRMEARTGRTARGADAAPRYGTHDDGGGPARAAFDFPIDINTAAREELLMLPGVGERIAEAIIKKRAELGGFASVEDLLKVRYIGRAKLDRMRTLVSAGNASPNGPRRL
jgi:competence ComEA-like helix-hairpin-helix protein